MERGKADADTVTNLGWCGGERERVERQEL
jgi:hypothetical protein